MKIVIVFMLIVWHSNLLAFDNTRVVDILSCGKEKKFLGSGVPFEHAGISYIITSELFKREQILQRRYTYKVNRVRLGKWINSF